MKEDILDKILSTFRNSRIKPQIFKYKGYDAISIDIPRKEEKLYHGSSFQIRCNKPKVLCETIFIDIQKIF